MQGNADNWIKLTLMLEEYLDGPEVDVDLILSEGEAVYGAITDNWPTVEPYFNETGSNCPSILPTKQQQELMQMAVQATHCLGFKQVCCMYCCQPKNRTGPCVLLACLLSGKCRSALQALELACLDKQCPQSLETMVYFQRACIKSLTGDPAKNKSQQYTCHLTHIRSILLGGSSATHSLNQFTLFLCSATPMTRVICLHLFVLVTGSHANTRHVGMVS